MTWSPPTPEEKARALLSSKCARGGRMKKGKLGPLRKALNAAHRKVYGEFAGPPPDMDWVEDRYGGKSQYPFPEEFEPIGNRILHLFELAYRGATAAAKHRRMQPDEHKAHLAMRRLGVQVTAVNREDRTVDLMLNGYHKRVQVKSFVKGFWKCLRNEIVSPQDEIRKMLRAQRWRLRVYAAWFTQADKANTRHSPAKVRKTSSHAFP